MGCKIDAIEIFLPEKVLTNEELAHQLPGWEASDIYDKIGIRQRHVTAEKETALDIGEQACRKLFANYDPGQVDFLMMCTQSPDHFMPTSACLLQKRLGLRSNTGALDFSLGCSGFVYGLATAKGMIEAGIADNVLLVTAETPTKHIHPRDRANRSLAGDAAAATMIRRYPSNQVFDFVVGTDGNEMDMIVPNGGSRHPWEARPEEIIDKSGNVRTANNYFMNGHEVFNFTMKKVPLLVREILRKNGRSIEQIDYCIFHQANRFIIEHLRKMSGIPEEKFYINMEMTGNTSSCTIPIALRDASDRRLIKTGDQVLLAGFGIGYSWAGTIIEI